ncbi:MAG: MotA/TolQ/ExbB proton channel family protein [Hahellaceae bacterium]|nr:MotA/TolQ/ExbB proton channel family protein [Hahellaceae bacterium]
MDIATLLGLLLGTVIVGGAILSGSQLWDFVNFPGLAIVVMGTFAVTLVKYRFATVRDGFSLALKTVFLERTANPVSISQQLREISQVVRKEGMLGMDRYEISNPFLKRCVNLCIDGYSPEVIEDVLGQAIEQLESRYRTAEGIFRGISETAPGLGMLGTLVGLVQMLNNMEEPSSIGPAMAIALLTTFYGAFIAQLVAIPLADKLQLKAQEELRNLLLMANSIESIVKGQNPRLIADIATLYLSPAEQARMDAGSEKG